MTNRTHYLPFLLPGLIVLGLAGEAAAQAKGARGILIDKIRNDKPGFYVRVAVDHVNQTYTVGDEMKVTVSSEKPGYLYLFYLDAAGNMTCVFPNEHHPDNAIAAGKDVAAPDGKQGQKQEQSVTGAISAISEKEQTITVTPVSAEQSQAQQSQPQEEKKGSEATFYVFCLDGQTQIVGDLDKKGTLGKHKGDAPAGAQKGAGAERAVAVVAKEDKGQGVTAGGTATSQSEKGKVKPLCDNFNVLKIGQIVEVTYVSAKADAVQQGKVSQDQKPLADKKPGQEQKPAGDEKLGKQQTEQAATAQAQATAGQSAATAVVKKKSGKGIDDAAATLRAVRIEVLNTVDQPIPTGAPVPPPAPTAPPAPAPSTNG